MTGLWQEFMEGNVICVFYGMFCLEAWLGGRIGQTTGGSRPLQNSAVRSGIGEAGSSLAPEVIL
jgi:hypothetical protein